MWVHLGGLGIILVPIDNLRSGLPEHDLRITHGVPILVEKAQLFNQYPVFPPPASMPEKSICTGLPVTQVALHVVRRMEAARAERAKASISAASIDFGLHWLSWGGKEVPGTSRHPAILGSLVTQAGGHSTTAA